MDFYGRIEEQKAVNYILEQVKFTSKQIDDTGLNVESFQLFNFNR